MSARPRRCVVVGGGIAGLVAGFDLARRGIDVTVLEATPHAGGKMGTTRREGYTFEWGPQSLRAAPDEPLMRLFDDLDLRGELVDPTPAARRRFVLRRDQLHELPKGLHRLLSPGGLVSLLSEPLRRGRRQDPVGGPETVAAFARRRLGREAAQVLIDALVTGIWAGDPNRLELRSTFPQLHAMEAEHGGLVRAGLAGALKPKGDKPPRRVIRALGGGMGLLPDRLARELGDRLHLGRPVEALEHGPARWEVHTDTASFAAEELVLAAPAPAVARMLHASAPELAELLPEIPYASVSVVCLGYDQSAFPAGVPEGFGFLIPRVEGRACLGCIYASSAFPQTAPPGKVQLRVMVGGRRNQTAAALQGDVLLARVRDEIEPLVGATQPPEVVEVFRWLEAIPQYEQGHHARLQRIEADLELHPNLHLAGNAYRGVAVPDVVRDALEVAGQVQARLS
jgi:protoporphyrinogen/coproporphyrinogen III oxidase